MAFWHAHMLLRGAPLLRRVIAFDALPSEINPFGSYAEGGYNVMNAGDNWLASDVFGNPRPSLFVADFTTAPFGFLFVTGGGPFKFVSVDTEFELQPGSVRISGVLNGVQQFDIGANQAAAVGLAFTTFSGNSSLMIDVLSIGIGLAGPGSFNVDNINVVAVPEPETYAFMLAGVGVIGLMARRKKR